LPALPPDTFPIRTEIDHLTLVVAENRQAGLDTRCWFHNGRASWQISSEAGKRGIAGASAKSAGCHWSINAAAGILSPFSTRLPLLLRTVTLA
jgi:hypothetical protein